MYLLICDYLPSIWHLKFLKNYVFIDIYGIYVYTYIGIKVLPSRTCPNRCKAEVRGVERGQIKLKVLLLA